MYRKQKKKRRKSYLKLVFVDDSLILTDLNYTERVKSINPSSRERKWVNDGQPECLVLFPRLSPFLQFMGLSVSFCHEYSSLDESVL